MPATLRLGRLVQRARDARTLQRAALERHALRVELVS